MNGCSSGRSRFHERDIQQDTRDLLAVGCDQVLTRPGVQLHAYMHEGLLLSSCCRLWVLAVKGRVHRLVLHEKRILGRRCARHCLFPIFPRPFPSRREHSERWSNLFQVAPMPPGINICRPTSTVLLPPSTARHAPSSLPLLFSPPTPTSFFAVRLT